MNAANIPKVLVTNNKDKLLLYNPLSNNVTTSHENVLNVVKLPQNPVPINNIFF